MSYPTFSEFLRGRVGSKWVVAARLTDRLRGKGHEVALTERRFAQLRDEWAAAHPVVALVATLPSGPMRDWIAAQVRHGLDCGDAPSVAA